MHGLPHWSQLSPQLTIMSGTHSILVDLSEDTEWQAAVRLT